MVCVIQYSQLTVTEHRAAVGMLYICVCVGLSLQYLYLLILSDVNMNKM